MGVGGRDTLLASSKSLTCFRTVCKRVNTICKDKIFANMHLSRARHPQFILFSESKKCSVEVKLNDVPSIDVRKLSLEIPEYSRGLCIVIEYYDGLLFCVTGDDGVAVCNPWLKQTNWDRDQDFNIPPVFCGIGYDTSRYKICVFCQFDTTVISSINEFGSQAAKCDFESQSWTLISEHGVSMNGTFYWVASYHKSRKYFIQSFDFSMERFKPLCFLPGTNGRNGINDRISLSVYRGDRFSFLLYSIVKRNIEIWVTTRKINNNDQVVEWIKLMNVSVPKWSRFRRFCFGFDDPPSYYIDHKSGSLVMCYWDDYGHAYVYIAKGDKFYDIKIDSMVDDQPRHLTYFPSLVQAPSYRNEGQA